MLNQPKNGSNSKALDAISMHLSPHQYFNSSGGVLNPFKGPMKNYDPRYLQQRPEVYIQTEKLPFIPNNQELYLPIVDDELSALGFIEFPANIGEKEQMQDNLSNLEKSIELNCPELQHCTSSIRVSSNGDIYCRGLKCQQYHPSQSYFAYQLVDRQVEYPSVPNQFGMQGILKLIKKENPCLNSLAIGSDLTTFGLNMLSTVPLYNTFASPWVDEPSKVEPQYSIPNCYNGKQLPPLKLNIFKKFKLDTLFYIFYSTPKDKAQLFAANELHNRGWLYHGELQLWFTCTVDVVPLEKTNTYEKGSFLFFNPNTWTLKMKDNFILHYVEIEKIPPIDG